MKKIPTLFERDWNGDRSRVVDKINSAAQWVADGEGVATRKIDGTCCLVAGGVLYKRRELGRHDRPPENFRVAGYDEETGKTVGWAPVGDGPEDRWHREAVEHYGHPIPDGTCELVGPKVQGNPEGETDHILVAHDAKLAFGGQPPRDFEGLREWLAGKDIEGIVWHHPDGRMAKIKLRDFGLRRATQEPPQ